MLLIPYRHVTLRTRWTKDEVTAAIGTLLDGPPSWFALFPEDVPGHRLRGAVHEDRVRLIVLSNPWHRAPYLPIATGSVAQVSHECVLSLEFRPPWWDVLGVVMWASLVLGSGGPIWFGVGAPCVFHLVGCLVGFTPEVDRVVGLLEAKLEASSFAEKP
jgi:hypothetical protein